MARAAEGNFYFIQSPEDVARVFKIELGGLSSVVGQNLVVNVRPDAVTEHGWVLNKYRIEEREKDLEVTLGDVYAVEDKVLAMDLQVKPMVEGTVTLAAISYTHQAVVEGMIKDLTGEITVTVEVAGAERAGAAIPDLIVVGDASRLQTARTKDEAVDRPPPRSGPASSSSVSPRAASSARASSPTATIRAGTSAFRGAFVSSGCSMSAIRSTSSPEEASMPPPARSSG